MSVLAGSAYILIQFTYVRPRLTPSIVRPQGCKLADIWQLQKDIPDIDFAITHQHPLAISRHMEQGNGHKDTILRALGSHFHL